MGHYQGVLSALQPVESVHKGVLIKRISATQTSLINAEGYCDSQILDGIKKDFDQALESLSMLIEDLLTAPTPPQIPSAGACPVTDPDSGGDFVVLSD